jgi:hypothetical protein
MVSHLIVTEAGEVVSTTAQLDTRLLAMLAAAFVPLLVNLVTKTTASDGLKSVVNIVAVALTSVLAIWINPTDQPVTIWLVVNTFLLSLVTSFSAYKGVWKPTGVSGTVAAKTASVGLGSPPVVETADKGTEERGQVDNDPNN